MNRAERRAAAKGRRMVRTHVKLPVNIRFAQHHETDLQLTPHTTLDQFRGGTAQERDWHLLALRLNWGRMLAGEHFQDAIDDMATAQSALRCVRERNERTGSWGVSQQEFEAIGAALNLVDFMQLKCTRRELRDALDAVYRANEYLTAKREFKELET